jgi:hypothetical protein
VIIVSHILPVGVGNIHWSRSSTMGTAFSNFPLGGGLGGLDFICRSRKNGSSEGERVGLVSRNVFRTSTLEFSKSSEALVEAVDLIVSLALFACGCSGLAAVSTRFKMTEGATSLAFGKPRCFVALLLSSVWRSSCCRKLGRGGFRKFRDVS